MYTNRQKYLPNDPTDMGFMLRPGFRGGLNAVKSLRGALGGFGETLVDDEGIEYEVVEEEGESTWYSNIFSSLTELATPIYSAYRQAQTGTSVVKAVPTTTMPATAVPSSSGISTNTLLWAGGGLAAAGAIYYFFFRK